MLKLSVYKADRRRLSVATIVFAVLIAGACTQAAQAQILSPLQVVRESDFGVDGLASATNVAISPDGNHVYAASTLDNAIAVFSRNTGSGELTFVDAERQGVGGVGGLLGASSLVVAPDGNHVYATGATNGTIAVFSRNTSTGVLTFVEFKQDFHVTTNPTGIEGLRGAKSVAISPDNLHVYVVGTDEDAIVIFSRNTSTGALTHASTVFDGVGGVTGLNRVQDVAVSPNGLHVYAVSDFDDTVVAFSRNAGTGALTFLEQEKHGIGGVLGLDGATAVTLAGSQVYVASNVSDAVAVFNRNTVTGFLIFSTLLSDGAGGVDGLDGARELMVAPNGTHLYVAGETESAVAVFARNTTTGALTYASVVRDGAAGGNDLAQPRALAVAPNNAHVYVASSTDSALTAFTRNLGTGALTLISAYIDAVGLQYPLAAAMAPDGLDIYVTDTDDAAVTQFARSPGTGTIMFGSTQEDGAGGVDGLSFVLGVAVSPDNEHVYTTGRFDDAVTVFSRDEGTGALSFVEVHFDDNQGGVIDGLDGAAAVVLSPDGSFVYVGSGFDSAIDIFSRHPTTGALTFVDMVQFGSEGVMGIALLSAMTLSPDGDHLYAVGTFQDTLAVFDRNVVTGELTFLQVLTDGVSGVDGLNDPTGVVVSTDGKHVYVAANTDDAVSRFARNAATGVLTYQGMIKDEVGGITTLNGARGVLVSGDSRRLYVASEFDHALTVFERITSTGALTLLEAHVNGVSGIDGLAGASYVIESPDEKFVYVTGTGSGSLAAFERDDADFLPEPSVPLGVAGALMGALSVLALNRIRSRRK